MSPSAKQFEIAEVAVDANGRLSVCPLLPPRVDFEHIYRAAMEVSWDRASKRLVTPPPREWSPADWFKQIVRAVQSEYGVSLYISAATRFVNVPPAEREKIELWGTPDDRVSALHELLATVEEAVTLLKVVGEKQWAFRLEGDLEALRDGDRGPVDHILAAFGGMGSLNDLYLCAENGHKVAASELVTVNQKLQHLTSKIWQLARAIKCLPAVK